MNELLISAGAEQDYAESLSHYAKRSKRAAEGFQAAFNAALAAIAARPESYPFCDDRHRFYLLKRYPFQVIYRAIDQDRWLIVAVAHGSRRPRYWRGR